MDLSELDFQTVFSFYLVGSCLVFILNIFKIVLFNSVNWILKANILNRNLKKIMPPDKKSFIRKLSLNFSLLIIAMLFSWFEVVHVLWQIVSALIITLREILTPVPETIKNLRFPLRNNPDMPRESVFAHLVALKIKSGELPPNVYSLINSLKEVSQNYPRFDSITALNQLQSLNVIAPETISEIIEKLYEDEKQRP